MRTAQLNCGREGLSVNVKKACLSESGATGRMWYGAIYYPEHWPEERWAIDAGMMRDAGFNVVRLAEFAWVRLQPEPGAFVADWLDRAIDTLADAGISVLLGTPTAGPPAWLTCADSTEDDCRQQYEDGARWEPGGRSMCCLNHPRFIEATAGIVRAMGERYARHPAVMGWQLDNEIGMYGNRCHCPRCVAAFRDYLRGRYDDIAVLNRRLGMIFGGAEFNDFNQIPLPRLRQDLHNPGLLLESFRFFADSEARYLNRQAEILRACGVTTPITHNVCHMYGGNNGSDPARIFADLDVAGWDNYPQQFGADPKPARLALLHAITRSCKPGKAYWMLEQQAGAPFGMPEDDPRRIRLWAWQSVAHGAGMILFFRWRQCRFGGEQYWRGILRHDGEANDRYRVIAGIGDELRRLSHLLPGKPGPNRAAILLDFDACVSINHGAASGGPRIRYLDQAESWYEALRVNGLQADVVRQPPEPGSYELLVLPSARLMAPDWAEALKRFTAAGGTVIATPCTGALNRDHVAPDGAVPHLLSDLFGLRCVGGSSLTELAAAPKEIQGADAALLAGLAGPGMVPLISIRQGLPQQSAARIWCDHVELNGARELARFALRKPANGRPAITSRKMGAGQAVYVAGILEQDFLNALIRVLLPGAPRRGVASDNPSVEVAQWESAGGGSIWIVLNHGAEPATVAVTQKLYDALQNRPVVDSATIAPYDVMVLT